MGKRGWHVYEENYLVSNYAKMTIKELSDGLLKLANRREYERRSDDSINAKIKRLKLEGRIAESKEDETVFRSLVQRRKEL
jgi:hypothetical protein